MREKIETLGYMLDCSRGAVPTVSTIRKMIDILSSWGYDYLMLYTEDTYPLPEEPYFGYMRGAYTQKELQGLDRYAKRHGMELRPCFQTLGHLGRIRASDQFNHYFDDDGTLLVKNEETYHFIDAMFRSYSSLLSSRHAHIGMDEAFGLGRGRYLDLHGYEPPSKLFEYHLKRVAEIASRYGYTCTFWADGLMTAKEPLSLPTNVTPMIWRYDYLNRSATEEEIQRFESLSSRPLSYAGGAIKWVGYVPNNTASIETLKVQLAACEAHHIHDFLVTGWADGAAEASTFCTLPVLFQVALLRSHRPIDDQAKKEFERTIGMSYDDFATVECLNRLMPTKIPYGKANNLSFIHLYQDPLQNPVLEVEKDAYPPLYHAAKETLQKNETNESFGYLFETLTALADVDELTSTFGKDALQAYQKKQSLMPFVQKAKEIVARLDRFTAFYAKQWERENKGFGLEKQLLRLGGLRTRYVYVESLFTRYENKEITTIDEYAIKHLPKIIFGKKINPNTLCQNFYRYLVSSGILNDN